MIPADHEYLKYTGRIDWSMEQHPVFIHPLSSVTISFEGTGLSVVVSNHAAYFDSWLGYLTDGEEKKILISQRGDKETLLLETGLEKGPHTVTLFKRMDGCHEVTIYGFLLPEGARLLDAPKLPRRKMEFYGDSITAGEVAEAVDYVGREDPEHRGEYSNAYHSYAAIAARMLHARVHLIAQGGIALLDNTGYFHEPNAIGMMTGYDKIRFHPELGELKKWDFKGYTPHVVVAAIGQNDAYPEDYMKEDLYCAKAVLWREAYRKFILSLREKYPKAWIILTTTILEHSPKWDRSIGMVCAGLEDPRVVHFLYRENGRGTKGHVRIPEAENMAFELVSFIRGLGDDVFTG